MRRLHFREKKLCATLPLLAPFRKKKERAQIHTTDSLPYFHPSLIPSLVHRSPTKTKKRFPKKEPFTSIEPTQSRAPRTKTKIIKREEPIIQSSHDYQPKTKNQEREEKKTQPLGTTILKTKTLSNARVVPRRAIATEKKKEYPSFSLPPV